MSKGQEHTLLALAILEDLEGSERCTTGKNLVTKAALVIGLLYLLVRVVRFVCVVGQLGQTSDVLKIRQLEGQLEKYGSGGM